MRADFLSIDCGVEANYSGDTDRYFGIVYVSDEPYTDAGENHRVAPDLESLFVGIGRTLRSFPSGQRNCYALPTVAGTKYLVRTFLAYGNTMAGAARRWSSTCTWDQLVDNRRRGGEEQLRVRGNLRGVGGVGAGVPGQHRPWHAVRVRPGAPAARDDLYPQAAPGLILKLCKRRNMGESVSTIRYVTCIFQLVLHVIETELWQIIFLQ